MGFVGSQFVDDLSTGTRSNLLAKVEFADLDVAAYEFESLAKSFWPEVISNSTAQASIPRLHERHPNLRPESFNSFPTAPFRKKSYAFPYYLQQSTRLWEGPGANAHSFRFLGSGDGEQRSGSREIRPYGPISLVAGFRILSFQGWLNPCLRKIPLLRPQLATGRKYRVCSG